MPGQPRSLLLRIEVRPAGRLSRCARNQEHEIRKGALRFVVKGAGPTPGERGYCRDCAMQMLERAEKRLAELRNEVE